jgi:hypothetical protein
VQGGGGLRLVERGPPRVLTGRLLRARGCILGFLLYAPRARARHESSRGAASLATTSLSATQHPAAQARPSVMPHHRPSSLSSLALRAVITLKHQLQMPFAVTLHASASFRVQQYQARWRAPIFPRPVDACLVWGDSDCKVFGTLVFLQSPALLYICLSSLVMNQC